VTDCRVLKPTLLFFLTVADRSSRGLRAGVQAARVKTSLTVTRAFASLWLRTIMAVAVADGQGCSTALVQR
jgi:hypothetical protein